MSPAMVVITTSVICCVIAIFAVVVVNRCEGEKWSWKEFGIVLGVISGIGYGAASLALSTGVPLDDARLREIARSENACVLDHLMHSNGVITGSLVRQARADCDLRAQYEQQKAALLSAGQENERPR